MVYLQLFILAVAVVLVLLFFAYYFLLYRRNGPLADAIERETHSLTYPRRRYPMERKDILPLVLITLVYSAVAYWGIGDRQAPESFCDFSEQGRYAVVELPSETTLSKVMYYSGIFTGNYFLQYSTDGETYTDESTLNQDYAEVLKWHEAELKSTDVPVKYVRIIADEHLQMGELALFGADGNIIPSDTLIYGEGCATLFDEQEKVPEEMTYMNSAYFDEVYHVRTAYENMLGVTPYENTHPPLGKLIITIGIRLFGLNPFGWRFMGVLFGILMLPPFYVFVKNMFGSTAISSCGTLLFAFDFMHFVQTRIATIDTYGVIFILLMYFFMYRYITAPRDDPFMPKWKETLPLFLSGLFFGIGAASKWIVIYGGIGLAIIWLLFRIARGRELVKAGRGAEHRKEFIKSLLQCVVFFIIIPVIIYYVSYYPYGTAEGLSGVKMYLTKDYAKIVLDNQKSMLSYHSGLVATHPYQARWYQWIVDGRPILYFLQDYPNNYKSAFAAFMNPFVCWGGLLAIITMLWRIIRFKDGKALFIFIGYLSQLLPWTFIKRITFEYHYFPSLIFMVLAICYVFNSFRLLDFNWRKKVYGATAACLLLFVLFYPVLTGISVPRAYTDLLVWIPGAWPFD